jgi:hypothetical protein
MVYAACDEYFQQFIGGRSADVRDLIADAIGALAALALLTGLSFWSAGMVVSGLAVFSVAVVVKANLAARLPLMIMAFYFGAHAVFTLLWIGFLRQKGGPAKRARRDFVLSVSAPVALLVIAKVGAALADRPFDRWHMVASAVGIVGAAAAVPLAGWVARKNRDSRSEPEATA